MVIYLILPALLLYVDVYVRICLVCGQVSLVMYINSCVCAVHNTYGPYDIFYPQYHSGKVNLQTSTKIISVLKLVSTAIYFEIHNKIKIV